MSLDDSLIVRKIILERDKIEDFNKYPFNIEIVKNFEELTLDSPVTFFVGENGIGKSTFIEAIAVALGLPAEGGTQNFMYETKNTTSELSNYIGINNKQIIGIGDADNDLSFLKIVGLPIAMGNANENVKSICKDITDDNDHNGVGKAINKYCLEN